MTKVIVTGNNNVTAGRSIVGVRPSRTIINGKNYTGENITIKDNKIIADGVVVDSVDSVDSIDSTHSGSVVIHGNVGSIESVAGDIIVSGSVSGNVKSVSGDIKCGSVKGSVNTVSGDINHS